MQMKKWLSRSVLFFLLAASWTVLGVAAQLVHPGACMAQSPADFEGGLKEEPLYGPTVAAAATTKVFAFNDLGMHCYDPDFSVLSLLPPFNIVHAQVVRMGSAGSNPQLLTDAQVKITYKAQADPTGSINKTSAGKTNFWTYVKRLYGVALRVDVGLPVPGLPSAKTPGPNNLVRPFQTFDPAVNWFTLEGLPITGYDDAMNPKTYSLMSVRASDLATGNLLYQLPTVVPASDEMRCGQCHVTGSAGATAPGISWSTNPNPVIQKRNNILLIHDYRIGTNLHSSKPVNCAECHYSKALDLAGTGPTLAQQGQPYRSTAVHGFHAPLIPQDPATTGTCFNCHPGTKTQCLRGVMSQAGIVCISCHGNMFAVGSPSRQPWVDEPKCQSCHTGDAVNHLGTSIRMKKVYSDSPNIATPRIATNKRFAEESNTTLYRNSFGHGGLACEACHGSTHAEWPSRERNDNLAAIKLQGHNGKIIECVTCHGSGQQRTLGGPHGLHNVNDPNFYDDGHANFYRSNTSECRACHGTSLTGTVLSAAATNRNLLGHSVAKGTPISCSLCHDMP
jgi:hypothetical protein